MPPPCSRWKKTEFFNIPDSLAMACKNCGFVWVGSGNNWQDGATISEWLEDTYKIPNTIDKDWKDGKKD